MRNANTLAEVLGLINGETDSWADVKGRGRVRNGPIPLVHDLEKHEFEEGLVYELIPTRRSGNLVSSGELGDKPQAFRYLGKQGCNHIFQSTGGGWRTSYTDAQLIGAKVERAVMAH